MKDSTTNTTIMLYFEGNLITPQKVTFSWSKVQFLSFSLFWCEITCLWLVLWDLFNQSFTIYSEAN